MVAPPAVPAPVRVDSSEDGWEDDWMAGLQTEEDEWLAGLRALEDEPSDEDVSGESE